MNNNYSMMLDNLHIEDRECKVLNCRNRLSEGMFVGFLCSPCNSYISTGIPNMSQAYRNWPLDENTLIDKDSYETTTSRTL